MNTISFMSANYVARELGYNMTDGWMQGDTATQAAFKPIETYAERLGELLAEVREMGFEAIDLWGGHLNPNWASDEHIAIARDLLKQNNLKVASFAGWWDTLDYLEATCKIAVALDIPVLGGGGALVETDRPGMVRVLRQYNLKYGLENHPEKSASEILAKIGDSDTDIIGAAVDTGWFGTHAFDAVSALRELEGRLMHIHLKDVKESGTHHTCSYGEGVVAIEDCVKTLKEMGYSGGISVEHEPEDHNPHDDVLASVALLRGWLA